MWTESNGAVCRDACAESRPPKRGAAVCGQPCSALCGMFIHSFYFISYYFLELHMMIFLKKFQETYNSRLRERYGDNPSTHPDFDPDLWMEVGSSGGPDKNRVYGLSNTRLKTCVRLVVSQPLEALHQYRTPSLRSSLCWNNNINNSRRIMMSSVK